MPTPIFIVGANRSGTTLLRLILNAHSRIAIPDELIYFDSYLAGVPIERWRDPGLAPDEYERFVDNFLTDNCEPLDELNTSDLRAQILDGRPDFKRPYQYTLEAWAEHYGKERWGEKTPGNLFYADVILDMFPDAQFIYMVRDPRAGVASMQRVSFFPDDLTFNALNRRKYDTQGRALLNRHVPPDQRTTVQYEELVRRPEAVTQSICRFLGEPFEPRMLQFHDSAGQYMKEEAQQNYNAAATNPITADRIDAWKRELTSDQIATVEYLCADTMEEFGYPPQAQSPSVLIQSKVIAKWMYWNIQCWRHRHIRDYTVKYPLFARSRTRIRKASNWLRRCLQSLLPFQSS